MAYVNIQQIGEYSVLRCRDRVYLSIYDVETKQTICRSLHTSDPATAIATVQSLTERRGDGHVEMVR
ncbi:hypothetical protein [Bradyrhizobium genosp. P]|uniref:hypothetical protein n=1 Tax=Bradyrhizobium genosp. P TaxID=83641 RepID=UPI003CE76681